MDEYYCKAHPHVSSTDCDASCHNDPYLNIELNFTFIRVSSDKMFPSFNHTDRFDLRHISQDRVIQEATIVSWLSNVGVPEDAFALVVKEIVQCICEMGDGIYRYSRGLSIRVDFSVTRRHGGEDEESNGLDENKDENYETEVEEDEDNTLVPFYTGTVEALDEDDYNWNSYWEEEMGIEDDSRLFAEMVKEIEQCICDMDDEIYRYLRGGEDEESNGLDENEDAIEVKDDEDNTLVPSLTGTIEGDCVENDYEGDCVENDYDWNSYWEEETGIEEDSRLFTEIFEDDRMVTEVENDEDERNYGWEEVTGIEEDIKFVPAAKSCVQGLKTVTTEKAEKCSVCFEDFNVGVSMPCSHMFHVNCIQDWLNVGNSCPLCRFKLPTDSTKE